MRQSGYTLIEVLVGLLIITLLFVGGYTAYREFLRRQVLVTTGDSIKSNLNLARQKAITVEKPPGCSDSLVGYEVTFSQTSYTIRPDCSLTDPNASYTITYPLSSSVTLATTGFSTPLLYKSVAGTNLTSDATITITHTSGEFRVLTVTKEGIIQ